MVGKTASGFSHRCEQLIGALYIPDPFDMRKFLTGLARQRGRTIELIPATLPVTLPCGMLISTDDADYIFHATDTTPLHAQHIDMHEVGHLLLDHAVESVDDQAPMLAHQAAVRSLLPDLSPELIRRILGRTVYSDAHEREAELFASILLARTDLATAAAGGASDFAARLSLLRRLRAGGAGASWAA